MRKTRNANLKVLSLESRLTPAVTVNQSGGFMYVNGGNEGNTIMVAVNAGTTSVYSIPGNQYTTYQANPNAFLAANQIPANLKGSGVVSQGLYITAGTNNNGNPDFVVVTLADGQSLPGDVSITTNKGADDIIVQSESTLATVNGRIIMKSGEGADNMFVLGMNVNSSIEVDGGTSGFRPGVISATAPGDVFELFASNTKAINVVNAVVGIDDIYGGNVINGNLSINNYQVFAEGGFYLNGKAYPSAFTTFGDPGYNGLMVIGSESTINGNVVYTGSSGTDGLYIDGTVTGNVTLTGGNALSAGGQDDFVLQGSVGGTYNVAGTNAVDNVVLLDGSSIGQQALLNVGGGNNIFDLDHTFTSGASLIPVPGVQSFVVTAGSGNDSVGVVSGTIGSTGLLSVIRFAMGDGSNEVEWNGTYVGSGSGRLEYVGGKNADLLTVHGQNIDPSTAFRLVATMGDGNDTVNIYPTTVVSSSQPSSLDFGAGVDTFNRNGDPRDPSAFWHATNVEIINP